MSKNVQIAEIPEQGKNVLANLFQLYRYDLSEFSGDDIDTSGTFTLSRYFDLYWTEKERHPFFIKLGEQLVGFVLAREFVPGKYSVAEFFVTRKHRRSGVGKCAAFLLFERFPAEWHVAQEETNLSAQIFWRRVVAEYTGGKYEEAFSHNQPKGPKLIFRS